MDREEIIYPDLTETTPVETTSEPKLVPVKKKKPKIKAYAWRLTASYVWIKLILGYFLGWQNEINHLEAAVATTVITSLSSAGMGFAPIGDVNPATILKLFWFLIITGLRPLQLIGLLLYIASFPFVCLGFLLIAILGGSTEDESEEKEAREVISEQRRRLLLSIVGLSLVCWLLLFGGATTVRQMVPGIILAGTFFILITFRLFQRSRPVSDTHHFRPLLGLGKTIMNLQGQRLEKKYQKRSEMKADVLIVRWSEKILRRLLLLMRGKKGRARVFLFVLGRYVVSLVTVALTAVTFWGIVIKSVAPAVLPLQLCLQVSISHFLPGIQTPLVPVDLPLWVTIAPSATAWILFVVYIGPASSLLPVWQDAAIVGLSKASKLYRTNVLNLKKEARLYELLAKTLPP